MESNKNLVLVGMMGSGKTLIGKLISKQTKLKFIDIDNKIEEKEKMKIAEIFKKKGEKYFRECEEEITLSGLKGEKQILSLGGGAYINTNIRKECKKSSFSFWLNWKKDIIIKRINGSKKRPLAMTLSETDLEKLINERAKIYSLADFTINCDQLNKNEIANKISREIEIEKEKQDIYEKIGTKIYRISEIDYFNDILGVSSIINACDLIITCSNVNAHLSGALGKRTFLLLPIGKGRLLNWSSINHESVWYPSIKIFQQTNPGNWSDPIEKVREEVLNCQTC